MVSGICKKICDLIQQNFVYYNSVSAPERNKVIPVYPPTPHPPTPTPHPQLHCMMKITKKFAGFDEKRIVPMIPHMMTLPASKSFWPLTIEGIELHHDGVVHKLTLDWASYFITWDCKSFFLNWQIKNYACH